MDGGGGGGGQLTSVETRLSSGRRGAEIASANILLRVVLRYPIQRCARVELDGRLSGNVVVVAERCLLHAAAVSMIYEPHSHYCLSRLRPPREMSSWRESLFQPMLPICRVCFTRDDEIVSSVDR